VIDFGCKGGGWEGCPLSSGDRLWGGARGIAFVWTFMLFLWSTACDVVSIITELLHAAIHIITVSVF